MRPGGLAGLARKRQARYGGNALLMSVAFIAILGLGNYLGARHHWRWDVTAQKEFSLSEQSIQVLQGLTEPVQAKLFFTVANPGLQEAEDLLKEYTQHSDKITYEVIDPDTQPRLALDYQVSRDGTIIFERGARREYAFGTQEQDLTSALSRPAATRSRASTFSTGHQERSPESAEESGYSLIKGVMERENYSVGMVNMAVTDTWPTDMSVLVVAGPERALCPRGDRAPGRLSGPGRRPDDTWPSRGLRTRSTGFCAAMASTCPMSSWWTPSSRSYGDVGSPVVDRYNFHQITKDMNGLSSVFATARSAGAG